MPDEHPLREGLAARSAKVEEHRLLRASEPYAAQAKRLQRLTQGFIQGLQYAWLMSRRTSSYDDCLTFNFVDDSIQSAVAVWSLASEGQLNVAKRELRYALEASAKHALVDQECMGKTLAKRLDYLEMNVPRSSFEFVSELSVQGFDATQNSALHSDIKSDYKVLCQFVHRSRDQVDETLQLLSRGILPGFEGPKEVESFARLLQRVYDIVLVLAFNGLGLTLTGDLFIHVLDEDQKWPYHKTKYMKTLSSYFDYKVERKARTEPGGCRYPTR